MTEPNPDFDTIHPSGHILFRSCRGGYLHSVVLTDAALSTDAQSLAEAIVRTADVSHLNLDPPINWLVVGCRNEESAP